MTGDLPGLQGLAFLSPELEGGWYWVVQLLNRRPTDAQVCVDWQDRSVVVTLPAISITTCIWKPTPGTIGNMPTP
jgi:hypothetical protein